MTPTKRTHKQFYGEIYAISNDYIDFCGTRSFDWDAYGFGWIAYKNKEQAEAKGEIVEFPCKCAM